MREKGMNSKEWVDREEWKSKIKPLDTERYANIDTLYIDKKNNNANAF